MIELSREKVIEITEKIMENLKEIEKEYKIKIERSRVGYDHYSFHFELKCRLENAPSKIEEDYEIMKSDFSDYFLPSLHTIVNTEKGEQFKIIGANLRARKYPIIIENIENGDKYKKSIAQIQEMCGKCVN